MYIWEDLLYASFLRIVKLLLLDYWATTRIAQSPKTGSCCLSLKMQRDNRKASDVAFERFNAMTAQVDTVHF